jgi:hypothetical protein
VAHLDDEDWWAFQFGFLAEFAIDVAENRTQLVEVAMAESVGENLVCDSGCS